MRIERLGRKLLVVMLFVAAFFAVVYTFVLFSLWAAGYVKLSDRMLWPALAITVGAGISLELIRVVQQRAERRKELGRLRRDQELQEPPTSGAGSLRP